MVIVWLFYIEADIYQILMLKIYRNYGKSLLLLAWWEDKNFVARFFHLELQLQRIIGIWPEKNLTRYSMRSKFVKFVQTLLKDWFHWRSVLIFVVACYWQPDASCTWKVHAVPNEIFQFFLVHLIINWISHENYIYYIYYIIFHQSYINMEYTNALVMDVKHYIPVCTIFKCPTICNTFN